MKLAKHLKECERELRILKKYGVSVSEIKEVEKRIRMLKKCKGDKD